MNMKFLNTSTFPFYLIMIVFYKKDSKLGLEFFFFFCPYRLTGNGFIQIISPCTERIPIVNFIAWKVERYNFLNLIPTNNKRIDSDEL